MALHSLQRLWYRSMLTAFSLSSDSHPTVADYSSRQRTRISRHRDTPLPCMCAATTAAQRSQCVHESLHQRVKRGLDGRRRLGGSDCLVLGAVDTHQGPPNLNEKGEASAGGAGLVPGGSARWTPRFGFAMVHEDFDAQGRASRLARWAAGLCVVWGVAEGCLPDSAGLQATVVSGGSGQSARGPWQVLLPCAPTSRGDGFLLRASTASSQPAASQQRRLQQWLHLLSHAPPKTCPHNLPSRPNRASTHAAPQPEAARLP